MPPKLLVLTGNHRGEIFTLVPTRQYSVGRHPTCDIHLSDDSISREHYPDGLAGPAIPLLSRIVTIADSVDAMSIKRSYRDPIPRKLLLQEISRHRGTQFDPGAVDAFLALDPSAPEPVEPSGAVPP